MGVVYMSICLQVKNKVEQKEWSYPCLVKSNKDGEIVLATGKDKFAIDPDTFKGFSLTTSSDYYLRETNFWDRRCFDLYEGELVLKNT